MSIQNRTSYDPIALGGYGFPLVVNLFSGAAFSATKTGIDQYVVPASLAVNRNQHGLRIVDAQVAFQAVDGVSGSYILQVVRVSDGTVVAQFSIAYNATAPGFAEVDARVSNLGVAFAPGDTVQLNLTQVGGTPTNGLTGPRVRLTCEAFGVLG